MGREVSLKNVRARDLVEGDVFRRLDVPVPTWHEVREAPTHTAGGRVVVQVDYTGRPSPVSMNQYELVTVQVLS